jgi:hypothetical protein
MEESDMNPDSSMKSPVKELNDPLADVDEANEAIPFPFLSASGLYHGSVTDSPSLG